MTYLQKINMVMSWANAQNKIYITQNDQSCHHHLCDHHLIKRGKHHKIVTLISIWERPPLTGLVLLGLLPGCALPAGESNFDNSCQTFQTMVDCSCNSGTWDIAIIMINDCNCLCFLLLPSLWLARGETQVGHSSGWIKKESFKSSNGNRYHQSSRQ